MNAVILDASVVLAAVLGEEGHESLLAQRQSCFVSSVNMAEARSRLVDHGMRHEDIEQSLSLVSMTVVDFTDHHAVLSSQLRVDTRKGGLSLGDRACLALAMAMEGTALTADRAWASVNVPIEIKFLR